MLKDIAGREVEVGDTIAYPKMSGSNLWMSIAKVVSIKRARQYGVAVSYLIEVQKDTGHIETICRDDTIVKLGDNDDRQD